MMIHSKVVYAFNFIGVEDESINYHYNKNENWVHFKTINLDQEKLKDVTTLKCEIKASIKNHWVLVGGWGNWYLNVKLHLNGVYLGKVSCWTDTVDGYKNYTKEFTVRLDNLNLVNCSNPTITMYYQTDIRGLGPVDGGYIQRLRVYADDINAPEIKDFYIHDGKATNSRNVNLHISAKDVLSGLYQICFSNNGSSYTAWESYKTTKTWTLTSGDGQKKVYLKLKDKVGNISQGYLSDPVVLDTTPPVKKSITIGEKRIESVAVNWNFTDALIGMSTNHPYEYALTTGNVTPSSGSYSTLKTTIFNQLTSKQGYYAWVRAYDKLDNRSSWYRSAQFSPLSESISSFTALPVAEIDQLTGQPVYQVRLTIPEVDCASYIIERDSAELTELNSSGSYTDNRDLQKHGIYQYSVYTENVIGDKSTKTSQNVIIPNISPELDNGDVSVSNSDLTDIDLEQVFYTNNRTFHLNLPTVDPEDDELKYQLIYKKDNGNLKTYFTELQSSGSSVNFAQDGVYQWYLQFAEFDGGTEITTTDPNDSDKPLRTRVPADSLYEFVLDTIAPAASANTFRLTNDTQSITYSQSRPTNNREVRIANIQLFDNIGVEEVYFWNDTASMPDKFYTVSQAVENNFLKSAVKNELASTAAGIRLSSEEITQITDLPWILKSGADGSRTVKMKVVDKAGNVTIKTMAVKLDTTPPLPPILQDFDHVHSQDNDRRRINIIWDNRITDVAGFMGNYSIAGHIQQINQSEILLTTDNGLVTGGSYSIEVTDSGYNQPVKVAIYAIDRAGNISMTATQYTAFTPAKLGEVRYNQQESGYNEIVYGGHFMKFTLIDPGKANKHVLEYGALTGGEFTPQGELAIVDSNLFFHQALNPHQEKYYRLVAFNDSGDRTIGEYFVAKVPNIPPMAPIISDVSYPQNFNVVYNEDSEVIFNYQPGLDVDGDDIAHTINWAPGSTPGEDEFNKIRIGDPTSIPLSKDDLIHGSSYTWYVEVQEIEETYQLHSESQRITFIVDKHAPLIKGDNIDQLYTNKESLKVIATDLTETGNPGEIYSNINRVFYQKNNQSSEYEVELTPNSDGTWGGFITLEAGEYSLQVFAQDNAGNISTEFLNYQLKVDHTSPEIVEANIDLELESGSYNTYRSNIPLEITITDPVVHNIASGSRRLTYWFVENPGDEANIAGQTINLIDNSSTSNLVLDMSGVVDNREYYLVLQVEDRAGNKSEKKYLGQIYIDTTAPEVNLDLTGHKTYGSKNYLADLNSLICDSFALDTESGIKIEEYNIYSVKKEDFVNDQWADWDTVQQTALIDGDSYSIAFRGTNGVGNSTTVISEELVYDSSEPVDLDLGISADIVVSNETIIITAQAHDEHSPITSLMLAIGSTPGGNELTSAIYGNEAGWLQMKLVNGEYRLTIPDIADGIYYSTLAVTNAAGSTSILDGQTIEVDNHQEKLIVNDEGPYTAFNDKLTASWQYVGGKEIVEYQYRVKIKDGSYITEMRSTDQTQIRLENLNLTHGETYQFEVTAVSDDGALLSDLSPGIAVDTSGPVIDFFNVPEYSSSGKIRFDWQGTDTESGVIKVEVALGSDYKLTDITDGWIELVDSHLNSQELNLITGQRYYTMFRITNGAGTQTDRTGSPVIIDDTPPPVPEIEDRAVYINYDQPFTIDMTNTILLNRIDAESGNQEYYWTYSHDQDSLVLDNQTLNWSELESLKIRFSNILDLVDSSQIIDGTTYYFAVKTINGAGLASIGVSDGITIDNSAPSIPELKVLHTTNLNQDEEVNYITNTNNLKLWIDSTDVHSNVDKYLYAYGLWGEVSGIPRQELPITDPEEYNQPQVISLTDLQLTEGQIYYFAGESCNGATIISQTGYSSGLILDASVPEIINVNGTASGDKLIFDWDVNLSTTISAITRYEIGLVTDPAIEPAEWIDMGLAKTSTIDATSLADGEYYLKIRAYNAAGNYSKPNNGMGISPLVILDRTKPEVTEIEHANYTHQEIEAIIKAEDNLSGISCYQYAVGTLFDSTIYSKGWIEVTNITDHAELKDQIQAILKTDQIPHAEEVYLRARVKDNVDIWSDTLLGGKIIVDHQPPVEVRITGPQCTNTTSKIGGVNIEYYDPESGVSHYRMSVASEIGGSWLTDPAIQPIGSFDHQVTGLELSEQDYYLVLEVFDRVGLSTVVYSENPVTIDITPPIIEFVDPADQIVFNHPGLVEYTLSEQANVFFTLTNPDGSSTTQQYYQLEPGRIHSFSFQEEGYGVYRLSAEVIDLAGNSMQNVIEKQIRVNEPPILTFAEDEQGIAFYTTPGKPIQLIPYQVYDPDGGTIDSYEWDFGDSSLISDEAVPEHIYEQLGMYTVKVKIWDNNAGETIVTTKVQVENTHQGSLYRDETWSGEQTITGDIIVPEGRVLTIQPGTQVLIDTTPEGSGYNHQILIQGELVAGITDGSSNEVVSISMVEAGTGNWQGIHVEGTANLTNVVIEDALRAITVVNQAELKLIDSTVSDNVIGVHVYGTRPTIERTLFKNNSRYGIKEDQGGRPIVINCIFDDNWIDYYHQKLSRITMDELNNLEGNSGNRQ